MILWPTQGHTYMRINKYMFTLKVRECLGAQEICLSSYSIYHERMKTWVQVLVSHVKTTYFSNPGAGEEDAGGPAG